MKIANLKLVWLPDIENEEIVATIQARFQIAWRDFRHLEVRAASFFAADAAEFVIVDQIVNGAMLSAHRAAGVLAQLEFAEFHCQGVEKQQAACEAVAAMQN